MKTSIFSFAKVYRNNKFNHEERGLHGTIGTYRLLAGTRHMHI